MDSMLARPDRRTFLQLLAAGTAAVTSSSLLAAAAFKPVRVNQYTYVAPDLKKTSDWYHEVFGMQIANRDAKQAHLWYGNATGDTLMIVRQAAAGEAAPRIEKFGFSIDKWDAKAVEAGLKKLGLKPMADGGKTFWFKDPEGNEIGVVATDAHRRPSAPAQKPALWRATSANHIVALSPDYKKLAAWYKDLLELRQTTDAGRDVYLWFGESVWIPTAVRAGEKSSAELRSLDHVAYTIENYNTDAVAAELLKRKMITPDAQTKGSLGINCIDVNGFKTQVCDRDLVPDAERKRPS